MTSKKQIIKANKNELNNKKDNVLISEVEFNKIIAELNNAKDEQIKILDNYYELINYSNYGFVLIGNDFKIKAANQYFINLINKNNKQVIAKNITTFIDAHCRVEFAKAIKKVTSTNKSLYVNLNFLNKKTETFIQLQLSHKNELHYYLLIQETALHQGKINYDINNLLLEDIYNTLQDGVAYSTLSGEIISANKAFLNILQLKEKDVIGTNILSLSKKLIKGKNLTSLLPILKKIFNGHSVEPFEVEYRDKILKLNVYHNNITKRIACVIYDITESKKKEKYLKDSEVRFRSFVESSPDAIFVQTNGCFAYLNNAALKLFGYKEESELLGEKIENNFHPNFRNIIKKRIYQLNKKKKNVPRLEEIYIRKDGSLVDVEVSAVPIRYADEDGALVFVRDISERKKIDNALKESEAKWHSYLENAPIGVAVTDLKGFILEWNKNFAEVLGYSFKSIIKLNVLDLPTDDLKQKAIRKFKRISKTGYESGEFSLNKKNKTTKWFSVVASLLFGKRVLMVFRDITLEKITQEALKKSELQYKNFFDKDISGNYLSTPNGKILDCNVAFTKMLGYKSKNDILKNNANNLYYNKHTRKKFIDNLTTNKYLIGYECELKKKDGKKIQCVENVVGIFNEKNELIQFQGYLFDITEQKKTNNELIRQKEFAESIISNIPLLISVQCNDGKFEYINKELENTYGYKLDEYRNNKNTFAKIYKDKIVRKEVNEFMSNPTNSWKDFASFTKSGKQKVVSWTNVKLSDGRVIGIGQDITERKKNENYIYESEKNFRLLFERSPLGIYIADPLGNILDANESLLTMLGSPSLEETKKINVLNYPALIKNGYSNYFLTCVKNNQTQYLEIEYSSKWGKTSFYMSYIVPLTNAFGVVEKIYTILEDITERKKIEKSLKDSEENFRNFFNTIEDLIFIADVEGKLIYANNAVRKKLGYNQSDLTTFQIIDAFQPEKYDEVKNILANVDDYKNEIISIYLMTKEGNQIPAETRVWDGTWNGKQVIFINCKDLTKESEALLKFNKLFNSNPALMALSDIETSIYIEVNNSFVETFGYSKEEIIGKTAYDLDIFIEPDNHKKIREQLLKTGKINNVELRTKTKDGKIITGLFSGELIESLNSKYLLTVMIDVTEEKRAELKLKENELKLKSILDLTYTWEYMIDHDDNLIYMSPSAETITGYSVEQFKLKPELLNDIVFAEDKNKWSEFLIKLKKVENTNDVLDLEFRVESKNGEVRWLQHICKIVYSEDGKYLGKRISNRDITDNKQTSELINKLFTAVEQSPVSIVITDVNGNIEYVNKKFSEVSGYSLMEVWHKNPNILKSGKQPKEFYKTLWDTILAGKNWVGIFPNKKKNGDLFWESALISPVKNKNEEILNFVAVKEDITEKLAKDLELTKYREHLEELVQIRTEELDKLNNDLVIQLNERKVLEQQLSESLLKEKEINTLKTKFIATVSHEFRTPLAGLLSSTQIIQRYSKKWNEDKLNEHYGRIASSVSFLTQLLDDVLTISRADRDILKNNPEEIDIHELLNSILHEVNSHLTKEHRLNFVNKCEIEKIIVDKKLVRQIITNLLNNAIKYSPDGGLINFEISIKENNLLINIADSGIGIPEDEIEYIFEPFYRSKNSVNFQGSGLGLHIVKRCIDLIGGKLNVKSKLNEGSVFNIEIPFANHSINAFYNTLLGDKNEIG